MQEGASLIYLPNCICWQYLLSNIHDAIKEAMDGFSLTCSGANRYKNAFDQLMHWNWDPAANENQAQAPAQPTAAPQSVPWCAIGRKA
jgi:hypothetical protein